MGFTFVSGSAALDLAGTLKWRRTEPEELLAGPADLERWLDASTDLPGDVSVTRNAFRQAISLREAVYQLATDRLAERGFDRRALDAVNDLARDAGLTVQLSDTGIRRTGNIDAVLAELARDAVTVLADREAHMKECGHPACTRIYLDHSRGARRTWCGMDECGNRVKAAAYRARKRRTDAAAAS
ncbi:CGNR zinc finger domain-containing protein [Streptomyces montanus]|uniref:CGNR zinc finger domain-containing protein n=1 Tax=Streptomyces montanus TaxID=2580423 RepID=UPI001FEB6FFB|nr:CGNR zinc finger domain-containing protein [Streptomyces montanus]